MKKLFFFLESINEWVGKITSWSVVFLLVVVVVEVVKRKVFNHPSLWGLDVSTHIYGFHFMLAIGYTMVHKGHVSIDIFSKTLTEKSQAILNVLSTILFLFPFCCVIIWCGSIYAAKSWAVLETGWGVFPMPLYLLKTVIPLTGLLIMIQGIAELIEKIHFVMEGEHYV